MMALFLLPVLAAAIRAAGGAGRQEPVDIAGATRVDVDVDVAAPPAAPRCTPHAFVAHTLSPPTGHNNPHSCPACRGQRVQCEGCNNLVPMSTEAGESPELTNWSGSVGPLVAWAKARPHGARVLYGPSFGTAGEVSNGRPEWAGIVNPLTGETGPGGREILGNASCGRFSGPWWDGQAGELAASWRRFLQAFKAAGGVLDEISLDTEVGMGCETIMFDPYFAPSRNRTYGCPPQRWAAIQRDPRFAALRPELAAAGMPPLGAGPTALWDAVRPCAKKRTGPGSAACQAWDLVATRMSASYFNSSIVAPALAAFPDLRIGDYSYVSCLVGSGIPHPYGSCGCGGCNHTSTGATVGNLQIPVLYQDFQLFSATYIDGAPRIGLAAELKAEYGVPSFNRTTFHVMLYDVLRGRETAAVPGVPWKPWVAMSKMGVALSKQDPYPDAYGFTNGSGYYVETMFHVALSGARDFYLWNPIQFQVDGADNQLFSAILRELDTLVGCANRSWVEDWPVSRRQPWLDRYVLTGMVLPEAGRRVWRFTPSMVEHTDPPPDPIRMFVVRTEPLTVRVRNGDDGGGGSTVTTITFATGAALAAPPRPPAGQAAPLSAVGLWIVENASASLPNRTLCRAGPAWPAGGAGCEHIGWPRSS